MENYALGTIPISLHRTFSKVVSALNGTFFKES
jgi:hypothetical protein